MWEIVSCRIQCAKGSGTVQLSERIWASFILCSFDQTTLPFEAASRAESSSAGETPLFQDPRLLLASSRGPPLSPNTAAVLHCSEVKFDTWVTACFMHSHAPHHSFIALLKHIDLEFFKSPKLLFFNLRN